MTSRRVVGAMAFADLAGFTAFTAERGDDAALMLVDRFTTLAEQQLPADGRIVKEIGDGLFIFVPDPIDAVWAMLGLSARGLGEATVETPLWIRAGVHTGSALTRGDDLIGNDVNIASRITDLAAPGEVLVSASVVEACNGTHRVVFESLGPAFLRGIDDPVRLSRAVAAPGANLGSPTARSGESLTHPA
jgi:adenylate cyclase